ncbi:hypothetical protein DRP53_04780 [candidate division WOR-3 bacterium]|uniref:Calcineurin-like phosphoesterase domain-containing protein n=1 Tax=candidate division WOR-3 bacterium TaxID=2052148 RepID=A0A660SKE3_UNCW3|nr:MAG: hypothetical protein DRP53_04780 [candidate division WOR-3 bacterium]
MVPLLFSFTFAVLGDNRGQSPLQIPEVFPEIITELNLLQPDLVVHLGDMILGYTDDTTLIRREWEQFDSVMERLTMPYHLVVGNHDVWDSTSEQIFKKRYGYLYKSFLIEDCHFIILDSELRSMPDRIGGDQLTWLKQVLKTKSRFKFVFLHKPLWAEDSTYWFEKIHPLLKRDGVIGVFSGHWHAYEYLKRDGIRYIVSGGAGAPLNEFEKAGGFYHYLLVNVAESVRIAVVRPGSILPEDIVRFEIAERIYQINRRWVGYPWIYYPPRSDTVVLSIVNPFHFELCGTIDAAGRRFPFRIEPGESGIAEFPISNLPRWYPTPPVLITINYNEGGDTITLKRKVVLVPQVRIVKREIEIDGEIDDWSGIDSIPIAAPNFWGSRTHREWEGRGDLSFHFRLAYDDDNLYFLVEVTDDVHDQRFSGAGLSRGDALIFAVSANGDPKNNDPKERLSIFFFGLTEKGGEGFLFYPQGKGQPSYQIAADRSGDRTIYEGKINRKTLGSEIWEKGTRVFLDLTVTDSDGKKREGWLATTPALMIENNTAFCLEGRLD